MATHEAKSGVYMMQNPTKYVGTKTEGGVSYRSSWEQRMYYYMDHNANVIEWSAETLIIPYIFSLDGKPHKYYPDIVCKISTRNGIKTFVIEIKPEKQTAEPAKPKNRSIERKQRYEQELFVYAKNTDKWKAATDYCKRNGMEFLVLTEKHIFGK